MSLIKSFVSNISAAHNKGLYSHTFAALLFSDPLTLLLESHQKNDLPTIKLGLLHLQNSYNLYVILELE